MYIFINLTVAICSWAKTMLGFCGNSHCVIALYVFAILFDVVLFLQSSIVLRSTQQYIFYNQKSLLWGFKIPNLSVCLGNSVFACTRLIAAEGNCSECFPLGEKPCCLQSESVEPMVSIKKYGTSSVAMEINSMEAAFNPQEDIIKSFGFHSRDKCCNSVVLIHCIVSQFND